MAGERGSLEAVKLLASGSRLERGVCSTLERDGNMGVPGKVPRNEFGSRLVPLGQSERPRVMV